MSRVRSLVVAALAAVVLVWAVAACAGGGAGGPDRGGPDPAPSPERVASVLRFAALAPLPPGSVVGPLTTEQGIDGFAAFRVRTDPARVGPWLAASGMPAPRPSPTPVSIGPGFPAGTPVVAQHRVGRPGGGVVWREGVVVADGVLEIRAFET